MNTLLFMTGLPFAFFRLRRWRIFLQANRKSKTELQVNIGVRPAARNSTRARCHEMSKDVRECPGIVSNQ